MLVVCYPRKRSLISLYQPQKSQPDQLARLPRQGFPYEKREAEMRISEEHMEVARKLYGAVGGLSPQTSS